MYADDTIIYVSAKNPQIAAEMLSKELDGVSQWLRNNHLTLNYDKTVSMCFSIKRKVNENFRIKIDEKEIDEVHEFKFLGVTLDSHLKFDSHVKRLCRTVKTNLNCFRLIRQYIPIKAAQQFMHSMIFSHLSYCITVWGQANQTTITSLRSLYKQALKVMDQKPVRWHHCLILRKHNVLSFDSFVNYSFLKLLFKCVNNLAPEIYCQLVLKQKSGIRTRGTASGNCIAAKRRTTFGQTSFSVRGIKLRNALPSEIKTLTELKVFNTHLKQWLKMKQLCEH